MKKVLIIGSGVGKVAFAQNESLTNSKSETEKGSVEDLVSFKPKEVELELMVLNENKFVDVGFVKSGRENRRERRKNERKRK